MFDIVGKEMQGRFKDSIENAIIRDIEGKLNTELLMRANDGTNISIKDVVDLVMKSHGLTEREKMHLCVSAGLTIGGIKSLK